MPGFWSRGDRITMKPPKSKIVCGLGVLAALSSVGCQVDVGGQTLPSPYYMSDDVQYFPAGPEFKLSNEAAAMRARNAAIEQSGLQQATRPGFSVPQEEAVRRY